jgi:hypothetical protein
MRTACKEGDWNRTLACRLHRGAVHEGLTATRSPCSRGGGGTSTASVPRHGGGRQQVDDRGPVVVDAVGRADLTALDDVAIERGLGDSSLVASRPLRLAPDQATAVPPQRSSGEETNWQPVDLMPDGRASGIKGHRTTLIREPRPRATQPQHRRARRPARAPRRTSSSAKRCPGRRR